MRGDGGMVENWWGSFAPSGLMICLWWVMEIKVSGQALQIGLQNLVGWEVWYIFVVFIMLTELLL